MVRISKLDEYGPQIAGAINEMFKSCQNKMVHFGELLVCQQNGFIFANAPVIGPGEEGGEYFPRLNTITHKGIGEMTSDDDYIKTNANKFFDSKAVFNFKTIPCSKWTQLRRCTLPPAGLRPADSDGDSTERPLSRSAPTAQ